MTAEKYWPDRRSRKDRLVGRGLEPTTGRHAGARSAAAPKGQKSRGDGSKEGKDGREKQAVEEEGKMAYPRPEAPRTQYEGKK